MAPDWYSSTFFNWHVDYHVRPHSTTGAGMTADRLRSILERVRPDMVQVDAKGHPGLASYPTRVGAVSENYARDTLRIYRDVTRELGLPLSLYYSTLVDNLAGERHPEWCIVKADGSLDTWFSETLWSRLCFNGGYVAEYMLPQLREIIHDYEPDGFWLDGDPFTARLCYCSACQAQFQARTGQSLPKEPSSTLWPEALRFLRDSYTAYVQRVCDEIHAARPGCQVAINWLQTLRSPGLALGTTDWLSGDVPVSRSATAASAEARYIAAQDCPGDIMICQFTVDEAWERLYYKSPDHQAQEAAVVMANGARVFVWTSPMLDGSIHDDAVDLLIETAAFIRARQPWSQATTSIPNLALYLPQAPFTRSAQLRDEPPELKRVLAAQQWLVRAGWHHDIVSDHQLAGLARWPVVLAASLSDLAAGAVARLTEYVQAGGRLLTSAPVEASPDGPVRPDLALLTGVESASETGRQIVRTDVLGKPTRAFYDYWQLAGPRLTAHGVLYDAQTGSPLDGTPEWVSHSLGQGQVVTLCGDLFGAYDRVPAPVLGAMPSGPCAIYNRRRWPNCSRRDRWK